MKEVLLHIPAPELQFTLASTLTVLLMMALVLTYIELLFLSVDKEFRKKYRKMYTGSYYLQRRFKYMLLSCTGFCSVQMLTYTTYTMYGTEGFTYFFAVLFTGIQFLCVQSNDTNFITAPKKLAPGVFVGTLTTIILPGSVSEHAVLFVQYSSVLLCVTSVYTWCKGIKEVFDDRIIPELRKDIKLKEIRNATS